MAANLRQVPLTCSGHTRPVVHLDFSDITECGYFLISACKGEYALIISHTMRVYPFFDAQNVRTARRLRSFCFSSPNFTNMSFTKTSAYLDPNKSNIFVVSLLCNALAEQRGPKTSWIYWYLIYRCLKYIYF